MTVDPGRVEEVLAAQLAEPDGLGGAVAVVVDGELVVDAWGGWADAARTRPWQRDTIVNVFSAGKGPTAVCAHLLAQRGQLDLDAPVADVWPAFAVGGKEQVTARQLLDHSAGVPAVADPLPLGTLWDWDAMCAALAAQAPWWEPGTAHGYHAVTFGFLVGEVVRRADPEHRSLGRFLREEVTAPLGIADELMIGFGAEHDHRCAELPPTIVPASAAENPVSAAAMDPASITGRAFANPPDLVTPGVGNLEQWRRAEIPASNAHATARGLAGLYGALACGTGPLTCETVEAASAPRQEGPDRVLGVETRFSSGFMLPSELRPFGRGPRVFGHPGAGGAIGFADPDRGLGFGFVPNQTIAAMTGGDPRWAALLDAVYP